MQAVIKTVRDVEEPPNTRFHAFLCSSRLGVYLRSYRVRTEPQPITYFDVEDTKLNLTDFIDNGG